VIALQTYLLGSHITEELIGITNVLFQGYLIVPLIAGE
jgi:hypothetical protein